jgi:hypothetical protein
MGINKIGLVLETNNFFMGSDDFCREREVL